MAFVAPRESELWKYIVGDYSRGSSIMVDRWYYLFNLSIKQKEPLKLAFRDTATDHWTKWLPFPGLDGMLMNYRERKSSDSELAGLLPSIDVHRSILPYEIIVESDYPTYEENFKASKIVGQMIENRGFTPHYYFSGNKSIHIHVFFDWNCFKKVDRTLANSLNQRYGGNKNRFHADFISWLRTQMITCWETKVRDFDEELIRASHLIRCELSRNNLGFKTFLGYSNKDMNPVVPICNEDNGIYPELGEIIMSNPNDPQQLVEEFVKDLNMKLTERKTSRRKNASQWKNRGPEKIRSCVKMILTDEFKSKDDGRKRGMFILVNELKRIVGREQARIVVYEWNESLSRPLPKRDIDYRLKQKDYTLTCTFIHSLLRELGIKFSEKCRGKVFKDS